ncbi:MAG TPA: PqqD family peptide modification chaperone [Caulobacteraceae bacterium]|jgi:predicted nucleotidyltransferase|nr:PqqD family peptide modification chaperone [Caulobacteraceae bacterium]
MSRGIGLGDVVVRSTGVIETEVDGEIIALDVETAVCYGLNRVGSHIWRLMAVPVRVGDLRDQLLARFAVDAATCEQELLSLLGELDEQGLIKRQEQPARA